MKRIMFFRPLFYMGGTEIAILNLISTLDLDNYKIYIGYTDDSSDINLLNNYKPYAEVVKITKDIEIDILINCSPYVSSFKSSEIVKRKFTYLWFHHFGDSDDPILDNLECLENLDKIITVSNYSKNCLLNSKFGEVIKDKVEVIYNVLNSKNILKKAEEKINIELAKDLNIVTISRLCPKKGFERIKYLLKLLIEKEINFKWFVIGGNFDSVVEKEIQDLFVDYKEYISFTGFLDNPFPILKRCDYLALLSDEETWGLVITEAKILKVPSIVTDFDAAFEQVTDLKDGIVLSRDFTTFNNRIDDIISKKRVLKSNLQNFKYYNKNIYKKWKNLIYKDLSEETKIINNLKEV